jgi:hypothetical protein
MDSFEEYKQMVNSFNEVFRNYQTIEKELHYELFKQGYLNQVNYKNINYYRCSDGQVLISNLN